MSSDSSNKKKKTEEENLKYWPVFKEYNDTSNKVKFWSQGPLKLDN